MLLDITYALYCRSLHIRHHDIRDRHTYATHQTHEERKFHLEAQYQPRIRASFKYDVLPESRFGWVRLHKMASWFMGVVVSEVGFGIT